MNKINIAIDGFSSCGKSTLAKSLAGRLHYLYVDSGAMYRAVTLYFLQNKIDYLNPQAVDVALDEISIYFERNAGLSSCITYLNGKNVEQQIRAMEVSEFVSTISSIADVRASMVAQQQAMARKKGIVMDGRDIGSVVIPDAELKIFMTAKPEVRARRRFLELQAKNISVSYDEILKNLDYRDKTDSNRINSPLIKADDALLLDNSLLSEEEQLSWALDKAHRILNKI